MRARLLVVGDAMADVYVPARVDRISAEAPAPVLLRDGPARICPGGALNVAANAAALGGEVSVIAVVGADAEAAAVRDDLQSRGVDVSGLVTAPEVPTITKTRFIARHQQIVRVDDETGPTHYLGARERVARLLDAALQEDPERIVLLSDYGKGTVAPEHIALLGRSAAAGSRTIVDPSAHDARRYRGLWGLKMNRAEAEALLKRGLPDEDAVATAARDLRQDGFEAVWITLGEQGSFSISAEDDGSRHASRALLRSHVTGAGDTFLAALGVALGEGSSVRAATIFANAASAVAFEGPGTTVVPRALVADDRRLIEAPWESRWLDVDQAATEADRCRAVHRRIGFTNGCFDLPHPGHADALEWAARRVDVLFVGLNTDETVRDLKGPDRPVLTCRERGRMLLALRAVDFVVPFAEPTPESLIRRIRPDVLFKGDEWAHFVAGREFVESYGGRVELVPRTPGHATSALIERVRRRPPEA